MAKPHHKFSIFNFTFSIPIIHPPGSQSKKYLIPGAVSDSIMIPAVIGFSLYKRERIVMHG